jgi:hypothetical protein
VITPWGRSSTSEGTPAIVMNDGEMLGGYLPPMQLAQHLQGKYARYRSRELELIGLAFPFLGIGGALPSSR